MSKLKNTPSISPYTGKNKTSKNTYQAKLAYTRTNLKNVLQEIIKIYPPEAIYFPDEKKEKHSDHRATGEFLSGLIPEGAHHYRYAIHDRYFHKTTGFFDKNKASLINIFQSQFHDRSHSQFLQQFAYRKESFE